VISGNTDDPQTLLPQVAKATRDPVAPARRSPQVLDWRHFYHRHHPDSGTATLLLMLSHD
jgi:hypothetical protein